MRRRGGTKDRLGSREDLRRRRIERVGDLGEVGERDVADAALDPL
jgi:hypothetical protein